MQSEVTDMRKRLLIQAAIFLVSAVCSGQGYYDKATVNGPVHDGVEIAVDLPIEQHVKNFGAPKDGKGLCVFASMSMGARWHNVEVLSDIIHKIMEGGGWPEKVDEVFKKYAPDVKYVQYEGVDPAILDRALSNNIPACVTYGYGERYGMSTIYHMVLLVHFDHEKAVILDNNFPGTYEWMSREEFLRRWVHPGGKGWAYVILEAPPPPIPHN
jgi:hypothetical protein